ncbi:hypothetical protein K470DRAFT_272568 [Piedraia hortae CBS 480.64]|uniref:Phosphatidate phosphatase APP1 catalytic domain-containing protein n=1 Tax=Piedraia hortae CBS 480.64 TaxID=1314780 RepID=A0A6A7BSS9_9PEZI|nr:hypothetical protein K470DRAFT_272568 [Piedraia hortae CBS 480.64]
MLQGLKSENQMQAHNLQKIQYLGAAISSFELQHIDYEALPLRVRNLNAYAYWNHDPMFSYTNEHGKWAARFHGRMFQMLERRPGSTIVHGKPLIEITGPRLNMIPKDERMQAFDIAAEVFSRSQKKHLVPSIELDLPERQMATLSQKTTIHGEFEGFAALDSIPGPSGNPPYCIRRIRTRFINSVGSQGELFLVPPQGTTIIADVDAVLRDAFEKSQLKTSAFKPFIPWMNMPDLFHQFKTRCDIHYHYITASPVALTDMYMRLLRRYYPPGSFDTGKVQKSHQNELNINLATQTFPNRRFILFLDSTKRYRISRSFDDQLLCIFVRDIAQRDFKGRVKPINLKKNFRPIPMRKVKLFKTPDELMGLDLEKMDCGNPAEEQED